MHGSDPKPVFPNGQDVSFPVPPARPRAEVGYPIPPFVVFPTFCSNLFSFPSLKTPKILLGYPFDWRDHNL